MTITIEPQTTAPATADEKAVALATRQAESLRRLADLIQANPHLADEIGFTLRTLGVPINSGDQRAMLAAFTRAAIQAGATINKKPFGTDDAFFGITAALGEVTLKVWASDRDQVCERVVTGTREVTEEIPDPEALAAVPTTTVTRTEEIVEWRCTSILAPTGSAS